jgi:hypothetical protein
VEHRDPMASLRPILTWANETGLIVTIILCIAYFGIRNLGGFLPGLALVAIVLGGMFLTVSMARNAAAPVDEYDQPRPWLDRWMIYFSLFIGGVSLFAYLGTVI